MERPAPEHFRSFVNCTPILRAIYKAMKSGRSCPIVARFRATAYPAALKENGLKSGSFLQSHLQKKSGFKKITNLKK